MNKLAALTVDDCDCPRVDTRFCGSRECPEARGSISVISEENFTPGKLIVGVLRGMVDELADMAKKQTVCSSLRETRYAKIRRSAG